MHAAKPTQELRRRRLYAHLSLVMAISACAVLIVLPPARISFYPACPVHQLFGIDCPGCGATRALSELLHGRLIAALRLNALFVLLLPAALAAGLESYRRALTRGDFHWPQPPATALYTTIGVGVVFTIARNVLR